MKKKTLNRLEKIKKVAVATGMGGTVTLQFSGCTMREWDQAVSQITEYPRHNHIVSVTPNLTAILLI